MTPIISEKNIYFTILKFELSSNFQIVADAFISNCAMIVRIIVISYILSLFDFLS
jgi:hypothetical protein